MIIAQPNPANNTVASGVNFVLPSNVQNLTLTGTADLTGTCNTLDNVVTANSGNDTLICGAGKDTLIGGAGLDTFVMGMGMGNATVIDSSASGGVVKLDQSLSFSDLTLITQGNDLLIQFFDPTLSQSNGLPVTDSMLIKGYYSNPQTSWTIQDANGNTTTPQALLDEAAKSQETVAENA